MERRLYTRVLNLELSQAVKRGLHDLWYWGSQVLVVWLCPAAPPWLLLPAFTLYLGMDCAVLTEEVLGHLSVLLGATSPWELTTGCVVSGEILFSKSWTLHLKAPRFVILQFFRPEASPRHTGFKWKCRLGLLLPGGLRNHLLTTLVPS